MSAVQLRFVSGADIERLQLTHQEILHAVEDALRAQGNGQVVLEPRMHLMPPNGDKGHFNILRGYLGPQDVAGVKVVGDFVGNYRLGLPSELALVTLLDPNTGMPLGIVDGTMITSARTGALTALGAKFLARPDSKILGHLGARGSAWWNVTLLDSIFDFDEIRVTSKRTESREDFAARLTQELGKPVRAVATPEEALVGADIMVEATRLTTPTVLLRTEWVTSGTLVIPYGTVSAVDLSLTRRDGQDRGRRLGAGARRAVRRIAAPRRPGPSHARDAARRARDHRRRPCRRAASGPRSASCSGTAAWRPATSRSPI